jgi:proteasome alpha subunit
LDVSTLEVAILDASRPRRAFRRITASALEALVPKLEAPAEAEPASD